MPRRVRVLLLADTHLGLDLPQRPRSDRPRRGEDFFAACERALAPARRGEVDLVVHGGDLLYRSRVPAGLVRRALEPLLAVADTGVPVVLVPGNHERSALPYPLLAAHEHLHVLDRPRTVRLALAGADVAVAGFPCVRDGVAAVLAERLRRAGDDGGGDVRLLALHQTVEGAAVGPAGYTFRGGPDVIPGRLLPAGFAAVLAGHIHRHQVLRRDLAGRPLPAPVVYPGATERTSFAERDETKGFAILEVEPSAAGGVLRDVAFHALPSRPMHAVSVPCGGVGAALLARRIAAALATLPADAVVRLSLDGPLEPAAAEVLRAATLRRLHPPEMIVEMRRPAASGRRRTVSR